MQGKCISCGFEGEGFEEIVRNLKVVSSRDPIGKNMMQGDVLLKCPKCGYEKESTFKFSTNKQLGEEVSKDDEEKFLKMKEEFVRKIDRSLEGTKRREEEFIQKHDLGEPQCVKCKKNDFRLIRTTAEQIMVECIHCGTPSLLDADLIEGRAVITFWTPEQK